MNRQEPIIGSVIPAISPTASVLFDKLFWPNVVSKDSEGNPLNGSMGFGWVDPVVVGDLRVAHQRFKSKDALVKHLATLPSWHMKDSCGHTQPMPTRPAGKKIAKQMVDLFIFFEDPNQEYFFLKKGTECKWLVRKTSSYVFDQTADRLPHRVNFEFIRKARGTETIKQHGRGIPTLMDGGMVVA